MDDGVFIGIVTFSVIGSFTLAGWAVKAGALPLAGGCLGFGLFLLALFIVKYS